MLTLSYSPRQQAAASHKRIGSARRWNVYARTTASHGVNLAVSCQPPSTDAVASLPWERQIPQGRLVIRPIERRDAKAAAVVLTRAFAGSPEAVALDDALQDINLALPDDSASCAGSETPPELLFLVARIYPTASGITAAVTLPPGQDSRLIGTASITLCEQRQPTRGLPRVHLPSADSAYISNMAVDPGFRRQGVARALLAACEEAARAAGRREVWLHVRETDGAARAMYDSQGYGAVGKDSWLDMLRQNMRPRILMRRAVV